MLVPTPLRVELLGGFRLVRDGRTDVRTPTGRQQQIIGFLVLHGRGVSIQRNRIAGALWPETTDAQALTNLRRELHHLREQWPALEALLESGSRTLAWGSDGGHLVDVVAFESAAERGLDGDRAALEEAARLYKGDILPDCASEWIDAARQRLRQRARLVVARLVDCLEHERAFAEAIEYAHKLVRFDSLDERAWCSLMRCQARRGDRAAALHTYQELTALLKKELGVQPSAATRVSYREILDIGAAEPAVTIPPRASVYPLAGRDSEWRTLLTAWRAADAGRARLCAIRGEAGIGKTRLAEELVDWCGVKSIVALAARSYAGEGRLAYAPIAAWLKSDALQPILMRLDAAWLTDVARLRPEVIAARPDVPPPERELESWQRLRFFEALAQTFRSAAPLVLVLDDLQWTDADTIEWLQYFLRTGADARCLIVATVRAEEEEDNPALGRLLANVEREDVLTVIGLGPLDRMATAQLAGAVAEQPLDEEAQARAFDSTEGHPLFIIERGRMEHGNGAGGDAPSRVQAVVAARLAGLSDDARAVVAVAAAVGRDFRFDVLAHAGDLEEDAVVRALDELWRRHIVRVQADERWDFSHDRIREVAYSGIGPARARLIHRRIAQAMESVFAATLDEVSASIAVHFDRGGQPARAIPFLERAATVATRVSANEEAIRALTYALSLVERLPAGRERDERELALRSSLSIALNSVRGYAAAEVEQNLDRVLMLSRSSEGHVPVRWLWVAFTVRFMLGDVKGMRALAEHALARSASDPACRCEAHHAMGGMLLTAGEFDASRRHFEASLAAYDEQRPQRSALGSDFGVFVHAWYSHTLWLLGDEPRALAHVAEAIALARRLGHPYSETLALAYAALLHQMRRDTDRVLECGERTVELCERYGFGFYGDWAQVLIGWARGQKQPDEGIALIESALERLDAQRARARRPYYLSLLADLQATLGKRERAVTTVNAAITLALERTDMWWLPALYFQKSELEVPPQHNATLTRALDLARAQNSRGIERWIRAAAPANAWPNV